MTFEKLLEPVNGRRAFLNAIKRIQDSDVNPIQAHTNWKNSASKTGLQSFSTSPASQVLKRQSCFCRKCLEESVPLLGLVEPQQGYSIVPVPSEIEFRLSRNCSSMNPEKQNLVRPLRRV